MMPADCYSFDAVNDCVHGVGVQFEDLQGLCLGMAGKIERMRADEKIYIDKLNELMREIERLRAQLAKSKARED